MILVAHFSNHTFVSHFRKHPRKDVRDYTSYPRACDEKGRGHLSPLSHCRRLASADVTSLKQAYPIQLTWSYRYITLGAKVNDPFLSPF